MSAAPTNEQCPVPRPSGRYRLGYCWWQICRWGPGVVGLLIFGFLIWFSLYWRVQGEWEKVNQHQKVDAVILWLCLGPVLIGLVRGWRRTIRLRRKSYPGWTT